MKIYFLLSIGSFAALFYNGLQMHSQLFDLTLYLLSAKVPLMITCNLV